MNSEKSIVYLETSVISYLTNPLSRDLRVIALQQATRDWWEEKRFDFDLVISPIVLTEISMGDVEASKRRIALVQELQVIGNLDSAVVFANSLIENRILPEKAKADALHIGLAAVNGVDFLLTWNCKHIANAEIERAIRQECERFDYEAPVFCTPLELMGD